MQPIQHSICQLVHDATTTTTTTAASNSGTTTTTTATITATTSIQIRSMIMITRINAISRIMSLNIGTPAL